MHRIRWKRSALNELAAMWVATDSPTRVAITAAAQGIDQLLQHDPENEGESRPNGRRVLFVPPLGALYRVRTDELTVRVLKVWKF
jgi:hypothetical protein